MTAILAMGTTTLAKANAIMKRLRSTETLGSTSAICSDKTGTLTLNQMTAVEMAIPGRRYAIDGNGYSTAGTIKKVAGQPDVDLEQFMQPLVLACDAVAKDGELIGDPTEGALVVLGEKGGLAAVATRETYPRVAELPFDTAYKLMATFHNMKDESGKDVVRCFVKGAPDQVLARSTQTLAPDDLHLIDADDGFRERYNAENARLGEQGLRVLATARKDFDPGSFDPNADLLSLLDGLTALALVGIVDPPRPTAKDAIAIAHSAGIQVRMITGDHAVTAAAIAKTLGITGRAITGAEFAAMSDDELTAQIDDIGVVARVTPEDKVRLVDILKAEGPDRRDDGRRRERRAGPQALRHRHRDGDHRHGGLEGGRGDDPHRRQLRDDREGRRARARPLRQPDEVHPLPDGRPLRARLHVPRRRDRQHRRRPRVRIRCRRCG